MSSPWDFRYPQLNASAHSNHLILYAVMMLYYRFYPLIVSYKFTVDSETRDHYGYYPEHTNISISTTYRSLSGKKSAFFYFSRRAKHTALVKLKGILIVDSNKNTLCIHVNIICYQI